MMYLILACMALWGCWLVAYLEKEKAYAELADAYRDLDQYEVQNRILIHQRDQLLYGMDYREQPGSTHIDDY